MDYDTLVVKESPGLCRCCLSEGCYKDLGTEYQWMNDTEVYADMLFECFDISITQHNEGPNGPNRLICEVCITRLRDACNFKKQVLESEKRFIDMIGRREFKPQMLIYQAQIKHEEKLEELPEEEVEYLEDDVTLQFDEDDQKNAIDLDEPLVSEDITVSSLPVKGKRGRPKKATKAKSEKVEKAKVPRMEEKKPAKMKENQSMKEYRSVSRVKERIRNLVAVILENSSIMPFKWYLNRYRCFYCVLTFSDSSKLKQHTRTHQDVNMKGILKEIGSYSRIKLDVSDISCKNCPRPIYSLEDFLDHILNEHDLQFDKDIFDKYFYVFNLSDEQMNCIECGETFKFFNPLLRHVNKYHNKTNQFVCDLCEQSFSLKGTLIGHIKNVHSLIPILCKLCQQSFPTVHKLTLHYESMHNTEKFKCPICPLVLNSRYLKKCHLATDHDVKTLQFVCDFCSKMYADKSKLMRHRNQYHLKEKSATCHICGYKGFPTMLKNHLISHESHGNFKCDMCGKVFRRKKSLRVHRKRHHV